jgi:hypothetical protein
MPPTAALAAALGFCAAAASQRADENEDDDSRTAAPLPLAAALGLCAADSGAREAARDAGAGGALRFAARYLAAHAPAFVCGTLVGVALAHWPWAGR